MSLQIFQPWGCLSLCTVYPGEPGHKSSTSALVPETAAPVGLTDARWVVGQELCTHREQSVAPDIGDTPCAAEELVTQETEKNVKPSLQ